jgi:hypothetical protein
MVNPNGYLPANRAQQGMVSLLSITVSEKHRRKYFEMRALAAPFRVGEITYENQGRGQVLF